MLSSAASATLFKLRLRGLKPDTCRSGEIAAWPTLATTLPLRRPTGPDEEALRARPAVLLLGVETCSVVSLDTSTGDNDLQHFCTLVSYNRSRPTVVHSEASLRVSVWMCAQRQLQLHLCYDGGYNRTMLVTVSFTTRSCCT